MKKNDLLGTRSAKVIAFGASLAVAAAVAAVETRSADAAGAFDIPAGTGINVTGVATPSGSEALLWSNTSITTTVAGSGQVVLHARGDLCSGAPQARVTLDGRDAGAVDVVNATGYWDYRITANAVSVGAGTHTVKIAYVNDFTGAGCDRNLRLGWVTMSAPAAATPSATPTSVPTTARPTVTASPTATVTATRTATPTVAPTTTPPSSGNPLAGMSFALDPNSHAIPAAAQLRSQGRTADAALIDTISKTPNAVWYGDWNTDVRGDVARGVATANASGKVPVLVAYNIPGRDCGNYSAGGAGSAAAYRSWIDGFSAGIGGSRAVVIVEPDALPLMDCLNDAQKNERFSLVSYAAGVFGGKQAVTTYLDAGGTGWQSADTMTDRLNRAGVAKVRGFSLNVSSFNATSLLQAYGDDIAAKLGGKHYVLDTSRNGVGGSGEWCNPAGRKIGVRPTGSTGHAQNDAFLWVKGPGDSDGNCNGGPAAGIFWIDYALGLLR